MSKLKPIETPSPEQLGVHHSDTIQDHVTTFGDGKGKRPAPAPPARHSSRKRRPSSGKKTSRKSPTGPGGPGEAGDGRDDEEEDRGDDDSEGDDPNTNTGGDRFWACPYWKSNPYVYYRCHAKYEFRRPGDVKLHMIRCHSLIQHPYYCQTCWKQWNDYQSWEAHHHQPGQCIRRSKPDGLDEREVAHLKTMMPRGLTDCEKWYWMWDSFFENHDRPDSPYVADGITEPATVILRDIRLNLERNLPGLLQDTLDPVMSSAQAAAFVDQVFSLASSAPPNEPEGPRTQAGYESANTYEEISTTTENIDEDHQNQTLPNIAPSPQYLEPQPPDQLNYDHASLSSQQQYGDVSHVTVSALAELSADQHGYVFPRLTAGSHHNAGEQFYSEDPGFTDMQYATCDPLSQETIMGSGYERYETVVENDSGEHLSSPMQSMDIRRPLEHSEPPVEFWQGTAVMIPRRACDCAASQTGMGYQCTCPYH